MHFSGVFLHFFAVSGCFFAETGLLFEIQFMSSPGKKFFEQIGLGVHKGFPCIYSIYLTHCNLV